MKVVTDLKSIPALKSPIGLTIGTFDGMHVGHQALIHRLREKAKSIVVFTFFNHPSQVFQPNPTPLLITIDHKLKLLSEEGVDLTIIQHFTPEFADQSYEEFLTLLKDKLDYSYLIFGKGDSLGRNCEGDEDHVRSLGEKLQYEVEYLPKKIVDGETVSSTRIRNLIKAGKFSAASALLGRPYSIYAPLLTDEEFVKMELPDLCLPPDGIYPIECTLEEGKFLGRAHIDGKRHSIRIELINRRSFPLQHAEVRFLTDL